MDSLILRFICVSLLSGLTVGYLSPMITLSRIVMLNLALVHAVFAGSLIGVFIIFKYGISIPVSISSIIFTILIAILVSELVERGFKQDVAIGIASALAATLIVIFSYLNAMISPIASSLAWSYVMGLSTIVRYEDLILLTMIVTLVIPIILLFKKELLYMAFDEDGLRSLGIRVRLYRHLLYALSGVVAATITMSLGVFVAHIILVVPGAIAVKLSKLKYERISIFLGVLCMLLGFMVAYIINIPPSGGVGIIATLILMIVELLTRRK